MSADPDNKAPDYSAELENLESRLHGHADDEAMLVEVGGAIRSMLADSTENESHIIAAKSQPSMKASQAQKS